MQCTSNTPVFCSSRDPEIDASRFSWQLFNGDERSYSISVPRNALDRYLCYDEEIVRKTIQNHEATFRHQVQELHQLYRRQRELMDELRMKEIFLQHLQWQRLKPYNHEHMTLHPATSPICNKIKALIFGNIGHEKRTLDLEYDDDRFVEEKNSEGRPNLLIDLNAPASMQLEEAKQESVLSLTAIDLNSLPLSCLSETSSDIPSLPLKNEYHGMRKESCYGHSSAIDSGIDDNILKVKALFDLNTDVITDNCELNSTVGIKSGVVAALEAPVSPENKEGPPPRGESEDIQLEPTMELDWIAANTLIEISCARTEPLQNFTGCLYWFAGIVSSTGEDLEEPVGYYHNSTSNGIDYFEEDDAIKKERKKGIRMRKRKNGCKRARKCSKLSPSDRKEPKGSTCSILRGWGQVRKREGGRKRPATTSMLLFAELRNEEDLV